MAAVIIAMLISGKWLSGLPDADPIRYMAAQWHKSFGLSILVLALWRLGARLVRRAPAHPPAAALWERMAASVSHLLLYALILSLPLSGWLWVSASPLGIETRWFGAFVWPAVTLPFIDLVAWEHSFAAAHYWLGTALIALLAVHVAAALKHHFFDGDDILVRILARRWLRGTLAALALLTAFVLIGAWNWHRPVSAAPAQDVYIGFEAQVMGAPSSGQFSQARIEARYRGAALIALSAEVDTGSYQAGDPQVNDALRAAPWLDAAAFPVAQFDSTLVTTTETGVQLQGLLRIRGIEQEVRVDLTRDGQWLEGALQVNRHDFGIGSEPYPPGNATVADEVTVTIRFQSSP